MVDFKQQMADFNFIDKYAMTLPNGMKETWGESIHRIWSMNAIHVEKLTNKNEDLMDVLDFRSTMHAAMKAELNREILSSQRARQWGSVGRGILDKNERMYNCCSSYCDRPDFFGEAIYLLLCGCGVGYSICKKHVRKLPVVKRITRKKSYLIPDTIEGWADAVKALMHGFLIDGVEYEFDYSQIRTKGSLISGRFKHSGHEPLKKALNLVKQILVSASVDQRKLETFECFDIVSFLAEAVLSGGVRRSATICLFSWDDEAMLNSKIGNWYQENPQRAMANISPLMVRSKTKLADVKRLVKSAKEFGEPGIVFVDSEDILTNPCAEIGMIPKTADGRSGWQFCNLVEINCSKLTSEQHFKQLCSLASLTATIQASYDKFPYLGKVTEQIVQGSALIGVSLTGIMDSGIELSSQVLAEGAKVVKETNAAVSACLGIQQSKRCCTVKPSGNASILLGTTSGIHPAHSEMYLRHIRINKNSDMAKFIAKNAPELIVDRATSQYAPNDIIIAFPQETTAKTKKDFNFETFFDYVTFIYENWVVEGDRGLEDATHNVSNTITIRDSEWDSVANVLYDRKSQIGGFSFLSEVGDCVYPFAPYMKVENIYNFIDEDEINKAIALIDDANKFNYNVFEAASMYDNKENILRVYAYTTYQRIRNEFKGIDWSKFNSNELIEVGNLAAASCAGGKCDI